MSTAIAAVIADVDIYVAGRRTELTQNVDHLFIASRYDGHHTFTLSVSLSSEENVDRTVLESHLGEPIEIRYGRKGWFGGSSSSFHGFIDEIIPQWSNDGGRTLTIKGWSPTVFLDCGPVFRCFSETTLNAVVETVLSRYNKFVPSVNIRTKQSQNIAWSVQSNETDYQYLCRLADQSALQEMWYDGECLHFDDLTRPGAGEEIRLTHGGNLDNFSVSLNTSPLVFSVKTYDYVNGNSPEAEAGPMSSSNALINVALKKSAAYPIQRVSLPYPMEGAASLRPLIRRFASKQAHDLLVVSGQSNDPRLIIGSKILIDAKDDMLAGELSGQFVVIHINHQIAKNGQYGNGFTAVPIAHPYNLRMGARSPVCGPMAAVVADCNDPLRYGRVKVQFLADEQKALSPWLRCLTPYTGRGGVFQPPFKGDCVMVVPEGGFNFESGAYVDGAFFHKNNTAQKWDPLTERGFRFDGSGTILTKKQVNTWSDNVQINARQGWSLDGPRGDLNCGKGKAPTQ